MRYYYVRTAFVLPNTGTGVYCCCITVNQAWVGVFSSGIFVAHGGGGGGGGGLL